MHKSLRVGLAGLMVVATLGLAPAATAGGGVLREGRCSGRSSAKLKLAHEHRGIQVSFEVDQNVAHRAWKVRLRHDGFVFYRSTATTAGASGSFTVRRLTRNFAGRDHYKAFARNVRSGETCRARASIR